MPWMWTFPTPKILQKYFIDKASYLTHVNKIPLMLRSLVARWAHIDRGNVIFVENKRWIVYANTVIDGTSITATRRFVQWISFFSLHKRFSNCVRCCDRGTNAWVISHVSFPNSFSMYRSHVHTKLKQNKTNIRAACGFRCENHFHLPCYWLCVCAETIINKYN